MTFIKIAFGSEARVGKDTACDYLKEKHGGKLLRFADPLYKILYYAQDVCGFPRQKDRKFLQWVGTEWGRAQNDTVWIDATIREIPSNNNCYVCDVRFPNELQAMKDAGFYCVRITRKNRNIECNPQHTSETALQDSTDWDAIIVNDGTLEEFYTKLDSIVEKLLKDTQQSINDET